MTDHRPLPPFPLDSTYISHLWEYPELTVAIFGLQVQRQEMYAAYEEQNIPAQIEQSLAQAEGFLGMRSFQEGNGGVMLQYWRSNEDLARYSRQIPHTVWWKWLVDNRGKGLGFYHEIYQCKTAEAIYEEGTLPVGPATFCTNTAVEAGEGRSKERQRRFAEAAGAK